MHEKAQVVFLVGFFSPVVKILREVVEQLADLRDRVFILTPTEARGRAELFRRAKVVVIYSHEVPPEVEEALVGNEKCVILPLVESYLTLARCSMSTLRRAALYFKYGGFKNLKNLVLYACSLAGLIKVEPEEPEVTPWHAIWHPELGVFTSTKEYLSRYYAANRPLVGILFYRTWWLYNTLEPVRWLIESLEREGLGVIPVFTSGYANALTGEPSAEDTIREFFIINDRPIIEVLIDLLSFFLLDHGRSVEWTKKFSRMERGIALLKKLNVPVIKAVKDWYKNVNEWLEDEQGISYLSQVYEVIMPEVDGVCEPIFLVGHREVEDYKLPETYKEHARYIARRVKKWVELRRKPPSGRKIAIVLNNPPCKMLEATIGVGLGLDVPESVVRLLHKLRELGYDVGEDELPKNGQELVKLILERRAISEFRWTSVEDIVRRGGYVDMVDLNTYMKWFEELPETVKKRMIETWGHPRDIASGKIDKIFAGAIHEGKFIIPGVRFGNIVIIPQPKFGCAGPVCDGRVCKILHDPTIPPPHQWLAVYRWITRVFKADLILHFGTHGYLEFRPGKGVGLSPMCWPEITIDDVPFLYVYIVSNPMEGVIAKRRGYAVLVDHVYPPMMEATESLSELDELVEQYERAKRLGEKARCDLIASKIRDLISKLGLPIRQVEDPDKLVEELHRYLDLIRMSQVEQGLHVFGHVDSNPKKLAEHVVTVMKYDTCSWKSILRAVALYLGLDYDELKRKPEGYCEKLNMSNRKALELLYRVAVRAVERLISMKVRSQDLTWEILNNVLSEVIREELSRS